MPLIEFDGIALGSIVCDSSDIKLSVTTTFQEHALCAYIPIGLELFGVSACFIRTNIGAENHFEIDEGYVNHTLSLISNTILGVILKTQSFLPTPYCLTLNRKVIRCKFLFCHFSNGAQ